ncbi:adenylate cyclase-associated CAP [Baffinella frigidus]|nr:adenylate cyclase-associated CAP [Cryptophyta sp. CCMP2293]
MEDKIQRFEALLANLSNVVSNLDGDEEEGAWEDMEEIAASQGGGEEEEAEEVVDEEDDTPFTADFADSGLNPVVVEYEALIQHQLVPFLAAATEIGGEVQRQAAYVAQAFGAQHAMLVKVSVMPRVEDEGEMMAMLQETTEALACIDQINEEAVNFRKHTAMVAGAMTAFGWVTSPDPRQYIGDMLNAVPVYGRQILGEYPQEAHQGLVQSLKFLLRGLQDYVSTHHPHGLTWNSKNVVPSDRRRSPHKQQVRDTEGKVDVREMLQAFDAIMISKVVPFVEAAYALGKESVMLQTDCVQRAFKAQRDFMQVVAACKRPTDEVLTTLLADTSSTLVEVEERSDSSSEDRLHLALVASGMPALAWVSVPMNPTGYVSDMINSIPVFGNKIQQSVTGRDDEALHVAFVQAFRDMLRGLNDFVRQYHAKGLTWNMHAPEYRAE